MSHSMSMTANAGNSTCKTEMLWNWNIIDSCFLSASWHVTNNAMFAASCIGTALLVICIEFLRRLSHEYDAFLLRQFHRQLRAQQAALAAAVPANCCEGPVSTFGTQYATFRASPLQQLVRAVLHGVTIGLAYIIMLLIMHFNGYIFISVVLGSILGKFLCGWLVVRMPYSGPNENQEKYSAIGVAVPTDCCA
ncbi:hypothetical protein BDW02DRAFT_561726 [Decorospora gaudefroyi]|uniref:Copper transport protein n=1 Tax=Decorospora gaudefroyi TaxID=184978 RepID=A0A6A5K6W9_9PLEO|nr:hypothetical protein BDW02DRAFT_561726 [Decorospora gaudefroyi]